MALPLSGTISLSQVNVELGRSSTAAISLGESAVRNLFGVPSGAISLSDGYGKSATFDLSISSNVTSSALLYELALAAGWDGSSKVRATINSGVVVSSNDTRLAAVRTAGDFPNGLELINNGVIVGMGGAGSRTIELFDAFAGGAGLSTSPQLSNEQTTILGTSSNLNLNAITFKPDGTRLFAMDDRYDEIKEYAISTPWDLSTLNTTAVNNLAPSSLVSTVNSPYGLYISPDGTKFYWHAYDSAPQEATLYQCQMSSAWDLSTASLVRAVTIQSFSGDPALLLDATIEFSPDGTKLFFAPHRHLSPTDQVRQYPLSTAWDISTIGSSVGSVTTGTSASGRQAFRFNSSGTVAYYSANAPSNTSLTRRFTFSTPYQLSSVSSSVDILTNYSKIAGLYIASLSGKEVLFSTNAFNISRAAFYPSSAVSVDNQGTIAGGGGGGGAGVDSEEDSGGKRPRPTFAGGGGGGGRSGLTNSTFGVYSAGGFNGPDGNWGTYSAAGNGGASGGGTAQAGGNGGNWGAAGADGGSNNVRSGRLGGAAGSAVEGNSNVTWIATGTRLGPIA